MAQPRLRAEYFVSSDGTIVKKCLPLTWGARMRIYERDKGICQICKRYCDFGGNDVSPFMERPGSQIDHILARSRGGGNEDSNLRVLCVSCNMRKGAK